MRRVSRALALGLLLTSACATPPPPVPETRAQIIQRDGRVGRGLAPQFEAQLEFRRDTEISVYLRQLAEKLMNTQPELQGAAVGVFIIQDQDRGRWWNFGLPGVRIYLSAGFLRETEFENQVAAAIAMELAYVLRRDVVQRIEQNQALARQQPAFATDAAVAAPPAGSAESAAASPSAAGGDAAVPAQAKPIDYTGPNGIFIFPEATRLDAIELAVDILYKAGFDPRGLIELWKIYEDHQELAF